MKLWILAPLACLAPTATARLEEGPTIRALMHKEFTVHKAPLAAVKAELDAESPNWEALRAATRRFAELAEALAKKEARHGDADSWTRLTGQHLDDVREMGDGAKRNDLEAVRLAYERVETSCKACHDAHKFRRKE